MANGPEQQPTGPRREPDALSSVAARLAVGGVAWAAATLPAVWLAVSAATTEDQTATGNADSLYLYVGFAVIIGAVIGAVTAALLSIPRGRTVVAVVCVVAAGIWGFILGFVSMVLVTFERHPTWDDA